VVHLSTHHVVITKRLQVRIPLAATLLSIACHVLALGILANIALPVHHAPDRRASLQFEAGNGAILLEINPLPVVEIPELPVPSTVHDEPKLDLTTHLDSDLYKDTDDEIPIEVKPTFTEDNEIPTPPNTPQASRKTISRTVNYAADRARFWSSQVSQLMQQLREQFRTQQLETASREISPNEGNLRSHDQQIEKQSAKQRTTNQGNTKTNTPLQPDSQNKKSTAKQSTPTTSPGVQGPTVSVKVIKNPAPHYPSLSRRLNEEGLVVLKIQVHADGSVGKITVVEEPGYPRLVKATISAVKKSTFQPALKNGKAIEDTIVLRFRFKLTDG